MSHRVKYRERCRSKNTKYIYGCLAVKKMLSYAGNLLFFAIVVLFDNLKLNILFMFITALLQELIFKKISLTEEEIYIMRTIT